MGAEVLGGGDQAGSVCIHFSASSTPQGPWAWLQKPELDPKTLVTSVCSGSRRVALTPSVGVPQTLPLLLTGPVFIQVHGDFPSDEDVS